MTKAEYYAEMRALFIKYFREHRLEIKKRLCTGEAPEINKLYKEYTYFTGIRPWFRMYNIWDYERLDNLWKHL